MPGKLSIRLHGGIDPRRCVELAACAEASGFDSIWLAENPFGRGALPAAAAAAAATARIGIGVGVVNPYNRHPTLIAMEIGALDELARGRARLGIGSGIASATERMGLAADRPLAAVRDALAIVRGMLAGEEVNHAGRVFSALGVRLDYRALRPHLPALMAARGAQALALCGRIADGLLISNMCPVGFTAHAVEAVRRAAEAAGRRPPGEVVQYVPCAARPDRDVAVRLAKEAVGDMLPSFWALGERVAAARSAMLKADDLCEADFARAVARLRAGEKAADALDARFVAAFAVAGTAADCLAQVQRNFDAGASELALSFAGTQPEEDMRYLAGAL
jgi:5,10-methylenetetrahydromethanopterin reductase